ncbi:TPA: aminotransferase [Pluralibacter gergoviae]
MYNTYRSESDLLLMAQEVAALLSCAAYLSTIRGEQERIHLMSLTGLAHRLSDDLANSLDRASFELPEQGELSGGKKHV